MQQSTRQALDLFFRQTEKKAYLMALALTHNRDDALELVQESMLKLVQKYRDRDPQEWGPLFFRILQNALRDWYRKQKLRRLLTGLMPWHDDSANNAVSENSTEDRAQFDEELAAVIAALDQLPMRQRQTFLLRAWQEFSTRETAFALSISENSVKTHYARATRELRRIMGDQDEQRAAIAAEN